MMPALWRVLHKDLIGILPMPVILSVNQRCPLIRSSVNFFGHLMYNFRLPYFFGSNLTGYVHVLGVYWDLFGTVVIRVLEVYHYSVELNLPRRFEKKSSILNFIISVGLYSVIYTISGGTYLCGFSWFLWRNIANSVHYFIPLELNSEIWELRLRYRTKKIIIIAFVKYICSEEIYIICQYCEWQVILYSAKFVYRISSIIRPPSFKRPSNKRPSNFEMLEISAPF